MSFYKEKKDNITTIDLTDSELEYFKSFYRKNSEYIGVLDAKDTWVKIIDGIYEKGIIKY